MKSLTYILLGTVMTVGLLACGESTTKKVTTTTTEQTNATNPTPPQ